MQLFASNSPRGLVSESTLANFTYSPPALRSECCRRLGPAEPRLRSAATRKRQNQRSLGRTRAGAPLSRGQRGRPSIVAPESSPAKMGRAAAAAPADPKAIMEARRAAYREEQGLPDVKWSCFAEQRKHEDFAAVKFAQKQAALQAKSAKPDKKVTDFVRRIRRVLDKKSREHGGTEGTYLRECFLNWDADCSGTIDSIEFRKAIRSLGLDISQADASYLVGYYGGVESAYTSVAKDEMTYDLLIEDVVNASIHFLQPQPPIPASARPDGPFPPVLRRFIKKVRQKLFTYITGKGENEQYLVRNAFLNWDKDASGSLSYDEFRA